MPRDLFGNVTSPFDGVGARSRYTVPLSLAAHTLVVTAVVVVPLLASDALPALRTRLELSMITPVVPPEPPRPRLTRAPETAVVNPDAAPLVAPDGVNPEPEWQRDTSLVVDAGPEVMGSIEHGIDVITPPPPPPPAPPKPLRVGGHIAAPTKTHDAAPVYPALAQAARVQGMVIIQATIGVDGRVIDAVVLKPVPLLDEAALVAVRQWRYAATRLNGVPVPVVMTVTVDFRLR